jgi:hypothetical protein
LRDLYFDSHYLDSNVRRTNSLLVRRWDTLKGFTIVFPVGCAVRSFLEVSNMQEAVNPLYRSDVKQKRPAIYAGL